MKGDYKLWRNPEFYLLEKENSSASVSKFYFFYYLGGYGYTDKTYGGGVFMVMVGELNNELNSPYSFILFVYECFFFQKTNNYKLIGWN